jgi:RNA polymerase sigma-70 factor (ECF subfamily)
MPIFEVAAERFAADRPRLVALAAKVLGSAAEAEDVVQDAWLRLTRAGPEGIDDLGAWLSTVVARAAIDRLRQRRRRAEEPFKDAIGQPLEVPDPAPTPETEVILAEALGLALVVVLDRLGPAERLAFVLHDLFGLSFEEVGAVLGRSKVAVRQLASRARRRVRGGPDRGTTDITARAAVVAAFAEAARGGRLDQLLRLLDPDVTLTIDASLLPPGAPSQVRGSTTVATRASAAAGAALLMLVDDAPALVAAPRGQVERVLTFEVAAGVILAIEVIAEPERLRRLDLRLLPDRDEEGQGQSPNGSLP